MKYKILLYDSNIFIKDILNGALAYNFNFIEVKDDEEPKVAVERFLLNFLNGFLEENPDCKDAVLDSSYIVFAESLGYEGKRFMCIMAAKDLKGMVH